ncbi:MAG TPA: flagellar basal-body MS-ring/collar protein FliF [Holophagaceae bacterium]|nr:flagellar basal-body MS-ring/collar protein FliF [Holophagaceae bacterium]
MAEGNSFSDQLVKAFRDMTSTQKAVVGAISLTVVLALAGLIFWAGQEQMDVLASNLAPTDANAMVESLKKQGVPYDLSSDQRTLYAPKDKVGELRLKFAGEGILTGDKLGWEKLENAPLTADDFSRKVMHRRALEADLAKTIKSLQQVQDAVVHISPVSDSPFISDKEEAKASVVLKLRGSRVLPEENTSAIQNLVAASVEGLKSDQVVVVDQHSRILSRSGRDPMVGASDSQKKVAREEEEHLVSRVNELLEPVVGLGKVRATAHVELDFDKVKLNEERFNPQEQVERSINTKEEKVTKRDGSTGVPGTPSNVAPATGGGAQAGVLEQSEKKESTTNFEISKTIRAVEQAPGSVKRLTLSVIVDSATVWEKDAKGDQVAKAVARTPDELKKIRDQVASAVGFNPQRGDQLTVENIAFASTSNPVEEAEAKRQFWIDLAKQFAPTLFWIIVGGLMLFFLVIPMLKRLSEAINKPVPLRIAGEEGGLHLTPKMAPVKTMQELEAEIEAELNLAGASQAPEAKRREMMKRRIQEVGVEDPESIAALVRSWLLEDGR